MALRTALFRADASAETGGGHVMRCLALANALERTGNWTCGFATGEETGAIVPSITNRTWVSLDPSTKAEDEPAELSRSLPEGCDLLVVDHYQRDAGFETACRSWAESIMVIDDLADRPHDCDLLLDQTANRVAVDYAELVPASCHMLLGSTYALLRPEFAAARGPALERRRTEQPVCRILVVLGASDPHNATSRVLEGIAESGVKALIDVVLGSGGSHVVAVTAQIKTMPQTATLHQASSDMAGLMSDADIAIGAGGTTSWERCCLGLPSLVVITADNQRLVAAALEDAGAARLLGDAKDLSATTIGDAVRSLTGDAGLRVSMSAQAAKLCDGGGLDRVTRLELDPPRARDGAPVRLRPAVKQDADLILGWQSQETTRRYFRNPQIPTPEEHKCWLESRLRDETCRLNMIMHGDYPAGTVRLDAMPCGKSADLEVSILVAPEARRLGIGELALELARLLAPDAVIHANVHPDNEPSIALFENAGYARQGDEFLSRPVNS